MNPPVRTSGTAIASLVFGIVCWVGVPFIGALVAVICGHLARGEIRRAQPGSVEGDGLAIAGLILGYVQLALIVLMLLLFLAVIMIGVGVKGWN
jgi:hypothetical protein